MSALGVKLPRVETRKQFMDFLENVIYPPKYDDDGYSSGSGRLRELKTYILESNEGFPSLETDDLSCEIFDTGLNDLKILRVIGKKSGLDSSEFYLETGDDRFFVLHTNDKSEITTRIVDSLTKDFHHTFDHTWFYSNMLKRLAEENGNHFKGFGVNYSDKYLRMDEDLDSDIEDLTLSISGSLAEQMEKIVEKDPNIERRIAFNKIRIARGRNNSITDSVQDDIHNTGYFSVKKGKSVQDHLQLVDIAKDEYHETISDVEDQRIGIKEIEGRTIVEGKSFDFEFPNPIENIPLFLERFFSSAQPFKLWGMKTKIYDDYFRIMAVDLHTGSPMDFEISKDMMRAYLFKGNCGNTILRLFTNLQMYYDSNTKCAQLN